MSKKGIKASIEIFQSEILMILRFQIAYNRISKFENLSKIGRTEFVDLLISLKAIENDLLLRLCKLNDNTKGVFSFKKVKLDTSHKNYKEIVELMSSYDNHIKETLIDRRNNQLAHLGEEDNIYDLTFDYAIMSDVMGFLKKNDVTIKNQIFESEVVTQVAIRKGESEDKLQILEDLVNPYGLLEESPVLVNFLREE